jgi:hypothetical protein
MPHGTLGGAKRACSIEFWPVKVQLLVDEWLKRHDEGLKKG